MKCLHVLSFLLAASFPIVAQPFFEVQSVGSFPILPAVDAEGVGRTQSSAQGPGPTISATPFCGFPVLGGSKYAFLRAGGSSNNPLTNPLGGPLNLAAAAGKAHSIRISIPPGATQVSFAWEFFDLETTSTFNDCLDISVINASGVRIGAPLAYADAATRLANPGPCGSGGPLGLGLEIGAPIGVNSGPQIFSGALPAGGAFILVSCANVGNDANTNVSSAAVDNFNFTVPVAIFMVSQPIGSGSLQLTISNPLSPNATFFCPVKVGSPGSFPAGWCFGIDLTFAELALLVSAGPPFWGSLNSSGGYLFLIPAGVPPGLTFTAGCGIFDATGSSFIATPQLLVTL